MQGPSPIPDPLHGEDFVPPSRSADRVYQTVTIAAILLVLGSLWVF
jgi:hypothetical protein